MDGWWLEGFNGENGWGFGQEKGGANSDIEDAEAIYRILEEKVIPLYYKVSDDGIPDEWVRLMKNTIKSNAAKFSARRMVREYIEKFYSKAIAHVV
jgi:starch phosphorylase